MQALADRMYFLVVCAHRGDDYLPERNVCDLDRASTIKAIAGGQFDDVLQIIELNPVEGICHDVTGDVAREVMTVWANEGEPLADWQYTFIELHVGIQAARSFRRAA